MRISHDPTGLVTLEELTISSVWAIAALGEGLEGFATPVTPRGGPLDKILTALALSGRSDDLVNRPAVPHEVQLSGFVLTERGNSVPRGEKDFGSTGWASRTTAGTVEPEDLAATVVAEDIGAAKRGNGSSPIHIAPRDRAASAGVGIFSDRPFKPLGGTALGWREAMRSFHHPPSVVSSPLDEIHFLPGILSDIGGPEPACPAIEGEAPGISKSERIDLGTPPTRGVGVVRRDRVGRPSIDVEAEHLAKEITTVLPPILWIAACSSIPHAHVEMAIRAERDHPTIMVPVRLLDDQDDPLLPSGVIGIA